MLRTASATVALKFSAAIALLQLLKSAASLSERAETDEDTPESWAAAPEAMAASVRCARVTSVFREA